MAHYKMLKRRDLTDDIPDLDIFIKTYLFESDGLIRRVEESKELERCYGSTSITKVMITAYPLGTRGFSVGVPCKLEEKKLFTTEKIEICIAYQPKYEKQMVGVMNSNVSESDKFYKPFEERHLARARNGVIYKDDNKVMSLFDCETDDMVVEIWDNKLHDVLEVNGESCMNKPYSYRRHIIENSRYAPFVTEDCDMAHGVICVRDEQYHPGARCSYMEVLYVESYRLAAGTEGWVYKGVGAGNVKYVLAFPYTVDKVPAAGMYKLNADLEILGKSSWCYTMMDFKESQVRKDFLLLYDQVKNINKNEKGCHYSLVFAGEVTNVGMRYEIWKLGKKYACTGRVYNDMGKVVVNIKIPNIYIERYFFDMGTVSNRYNCVYIVEELGEVELSSYRNFFIVTKQFLPLKKGSYYDPSKQEPKIKISAKTRKKYFKNDKGLLEV